MQWGADVTQSERRWASLVLLASLCLLRRRLASARVWWRDAGYLLAARRKSPIQDRQLECPHPPDFQRMTGNQWGSYVHCRLCHLRLQYLSKEDRADVRAKMKEKIRQSAMRSRPQAAEEKPRCSGKTRPARKASGSAAQKSQAGNEQGLEKAILTLAQAQIGQTELLGRQLDSLAAAQEANARVLTAAVGSVENTVKTALEGVRDSVRQVLHTTGHPQETREQEEEEVSQDIHMVDLTEQYHICSPRTES